MDRRPRKEEPMEERRLLGIDLGIASAHTAVALRTDGSEVARRRCVPTVDSLAAVEQAALRDAPEGTRLEVVIEPSGPAWLPIAVFFGRRGHTVYRVSSAKAADLRRFLSRHAKSNGIDAKTLARLPLVDPENLYPVELPGADRASLDRRVRACDRLTRAAATHKIRIKDLVRQLMPTSPLTGELTRADLAVLERYADPNALLMQGKARLVALIKRASNNHAGPERAEHAEARESAYGRVDPEGLARSLPGVAEVGGPVLQAAVGRAQRFGSAAAFKSFTGLTPMATEPGQTDRKGQPMSKAGPHLLRNQLLRSAYTARTIAPQHARTHHTPLG